MTVPRPCDRFLRRFQHGVVGPAVYVPTKRFWKNSHPEWKVVQRRSANAIAVVLNDKNHRQIFLDGESDGFVKLALPRRRITNSAEYDTARTS